MHTPKRYRDIQEPLPPAVAQGPHNHYISRAHLCVFFCYRHQICHHPSAIPTLISQNMNQTKNPTNPPIQQAYLNAQGAQQPGDCSRWVSRPLSLPGRRSRTLQVEAEAKAAQLGTADAALHPNNSAFRAASTKTPASHLCLL